jgi:hypothetical protein
MSPKPAVEKSSALHASEGARLSVPPALVLRYLQEALTADPLAPLLMGLKPALKAGAALHAGLEFEPPSAIRRLAGRYVLVACLQLDAVVDALPDFARASLVHGFVRAALEASASPRELRRRVLGCRELTWTERLKTLRVLHNLVALVRQADALLETPERRRFFRDTLSGLIAAVVEDMNLEARTHDTLVALAPEYPAMGLSGLEVLWLLKGRPLEEILTYRPLLARGEQLARLEDDLLEVWKARGHAEGEARVDRRNLVLRHAKNLGGTLSAAFTQACHIAGRLERRLERELDTVRDAHLAQEMRRVLTFFPAYVDMLIGPHRLPERDAEPSPAAPSIQQAS